MLLRKDYAFLQTLIGTVLFFVPIILILTMEQHGNYSWKNLFGFSLFGLTAGITGSIHVLNAYYKLTEQFKFEEYEDFRKSQTTEKEGEK
ncbi:MAG: hypothetical protein ACLFUR_03645 [Candidatus Hadarchaeia archaeon]